MGDMYTDIERSIERTLFAAKTAAGYTYPIFNNMISKKDIKDQHAAIGIMKAADSFQPANGGGTKAVIRTPVLVNDIVTGFTIQQWPDGFDLLYQFTVIADQLPDLRKLDQLIRDALKPRQRMMIWDSTANAGAGAFSNSYANYQYAGYINRDVPDDSIYWRVTNIRFEVYNFPEVLTNEGVINNIDFSFLMGNNSVNNPIVPPPVGVQQVPPTVVSLAKSVFPTGVRNGVNTVFTLPDAPIGLVLAYLNGQYVPAHDVNNLVNWTLAGNIFTTVGFVVKASDELVIVY